MNRPPESRAPWRSGDRLPRGDRIGDLDLDRTAEDNEADGIGTDLDIFDAEQTWRPHPLLDSRRGAAAPRRPDSNPLPKERKR